MLLSAGKVIHIIQDKQDSFEFSQKKLLKSVPLVRMKSEITLYIVEINKTLYSELKKSDCMNMVKQTFLPQIIMQSFGLNHDDYEIVAEQHGKPVIKSSKLENLHFNISHTDNYWVCATAMCEVGIDIETCAKGRKNIVEYYFTDKEKRNLEQSQDYNRTFFEIWTGKEAYAKMTGQGLSATLLRSCTITQNAVNINQEGVAHLYRVNISENTLCTIATKQIINSVKIINIHSTTTL